MLCHAAVLSLSLVKVEFLVHGVDVVALARGGLVDLPRVFADRASTLSGVTPFNRVVGIAGVFSHRIWRAVSMLPTTLMTFVWMRALRQRFSALAF